MCFHHVRHSKPWRADLLLGLRHHEPNGIPGIRPWRASPPDAMLKATPSLMNFHAVYVRRAYRSGGHRKEHGRVRVIRSFPNILLVASASSLLDERVLH